jgi:hypothetical protein
MVELRAHATLVLDARGPGHHHAVAGASKVGCNLLGPLERRVHRMRPPDRVVIERRRATKLVHPAQDFAEFFRNCVEKSHFIEQPLRSAFGARTIIALNVDDQRIVEFAHLRDRIDDAAHLSVAIAQRRGVDLHHAGGDHLVIGIE